MPRGRKPKYTPEKAAIICKAIADGETIQYACKRANISDETYKRWKDKYVEFRDAIKRAEADYNKWYTDELVRDCKRSLKTLVLGTEYDETTIEYESDKDGNPRIKKQKTITKKIMPNPTAIIFALTNRDPENWKNRHTNEITGNLKTETDANVDLSALPDELLEQVLNKINGGE